MNGYQGNLEKHLQREMFKDRSTSGNSLNNPLLSYGNNGMYTPSQPSSTPPYSSTPTTPSSYGLPPTPKQHQTQPAAQPSTANNFEKKDGPQLHPAIRQQYSSMFNNSYEPPRAQYISPPSAQHSSPAYQMQRPAPQQNPAAPPTHYYQKPYQLPASMTKNASPITPTFPSNGQKPYPTPSHPHSYQPQYHSHTQPQAHTQYQQENKPVYAHQQFFQKPQTQAPMMQPTALTSVPPQSQPQAQSQSQAQPQAPAQALPQTQATAKVSYDLPDVPVDYTSTIETMMANLRKARASGI